MQSKKKTTFRAQLMLTEEEERVVNERAAYYGISKSAYIKMIIMQHTRSSLEKLGALK